MAVSLHQLLKTMTEMGGTDLHITTNSPPQIRVDGKLRPLDLPPLTTVETKQLAYSVLTDAQKHRFEESLELDFSFGIKGLARFRANIFMQRGAVAAVYRTIPYEIRGFKELGLPSVIADDLRQAARPGAGHRADRLAASRRPSPRCSTRSTTSGTSTSSPSRTRSSTCTTTRSAWSTSARCTPTPTASPTRCAPRCARTPTWC